MGDFGLPLVDTPIGSVREGFQLVDLKNFVFFQEGPGLRKWQWTENGMKVINVTNILGDGNFDPTNTSRHIDLDEFLKKYSHFAIQPDDIVVASSGNTYGKVSRVAAQHLPLMMNTSVIRFRPLAGVELDADYLYGFLRSPFFRQQVEQFVIGSAQPNFGPTHVKLMKLVLPPFPTQKRIAEILSAYDDLIENNTRRIGILEEMARRLYDEWFVHFRFPGHEEVEFVEQDGQRIPKGWVPVYLYDVAEVTYGYPFKSKQFNAVEEGLGVIRIRDVMADRASAFTLEEGKPHHRVADGDILIGMDGAFYLGRWAGGSAWLNQRVARLRPKAPMSRHLLFQSVAQPIKRLEETIVGTTVAHLSARDLKEMSLVLPDRDRLELAARHLEPVFDQLLILKRKNSNLRAQRDLLLPKLVSGEIDVSHAEATLEAAE